MFLLLLNHIRVPFDAISILYDHIVSLEQFHESDFRINFQPHMVILQNVAK